MNRQRMPLCIKFVRRLSLFELFRRLLIGSGSLDTRRRRRLLPGYLTDRYRTVVKRSEIGKHVQLIVLRRGSRWRKKTLLLLLCRPTRRQREGDGVQPLQKIQLTDGRSSWMGADDHTNPTISAARNAPQRFCRGHAYHPTNSSPAAGMRYSPKRVRFWKGIFGSGSGAPVNRCPVCGR